MFRYTNVLSDQYSVDENALDESVVDESTPTPPMGGCISPTLAHIFLAHHEENRLNICPLVSNLLRISVTLMILFSYLVIILIFYHFVDI